MTQKEQQSIVQQALKHETEKLMLQNKYNQLYAEVFSEPQPETPKKQAFKPHVVVDPTPKINHPVLKVIISVLIGYPGMWILLGFSALSNIDVLINFCIVLCGIGVFLPVIVAFGLVVQHSIRVKRFKQSERYKKYQIDCSEAEMANIRQQRWIEHTFIEAKNKYETNILPEYNKRKQIWQSTKDTQLLQMSNTLTNIINTLNVFYSNTKLLPCRYHNISALKFIYDEMNSTCCDLDHAIQAYDMYVLVELARKQSESQLRQEQIVSETTDRQIQYEQSIQDDMDRQIRHQRRTDIMKGLAGIYGLHQMHKTEQTVENLGSAVADLKSEIIKKSKMSK